LYFDVSFYEGILYIIDLSYDVRITELLYIVPKYTTFNFLSSHENIGQNWRTSKMGWIWVARKIGRKRRNEGRDETIDFVLNENDVANYVENYKLMIFCTWI